MKTKLLFNSEIIIEITVKPEWKQNCVSSPRTLSKLIIEQCHVISDWQPSFFHLISINFNVQLFIAACGNWSVNKTCGVLLKN